MRSAARTPRRHVRANGDRRGHILKHVPRREILDEGQTQLRTTFDVVTVKIPERIASKTSRQQRAALATVLMFFLPSSSNCVTQSPEKRFLLVRRVCSAFGDVSLKFVECKKTEMIVAQTEAGKERNARAASPREPRPLNSALVFCLLRLFIVT